MQIRSKKKLFFAFLVACVFVLSSVWIRENKKPNKPDISSHPCLTVYVYDSFLSEGGIGSYVKNAFEELSRCKLNLVSVGDGAQLVNRIFLERDKKEFLADVVVGVDQYLLSSIQEFVWLDQEWKPFEWMRLSEKYRQLPGFYPYDVGYFSWIANMDELKKRNLALPKKLSDFLKPEYQKTFVLQDPRTSTPGFGFLLYSYSIFGSERVERWKDLSRAWLFLSSGWDQAYSYFLQKKVPFVWSYTTSESYHREEGQNEFQAVKLEEGFLEQIEGSIITEKGGSEEKKTFSRLFLEVLWSHEIQSKIPKSNWMFPVREDIEIPKSFKRPKKEEIFSLGETSVNYQEMTDLWQKSIESR